MIPNVGDHLASHAPTVSGRPSVKRMQLTRLVRRSGKAVWLLVLVPVLAVAASIVVTMRTEPTEQLLATVSVISPDGTSTAATVTQAVDGFKSTVVSDGVVQLAADDSGVGLGATDVRAERIGTSNLVELRVTTQPGEDGQAALVALVDQANRALFSSALSTAEARVATAEQRYKKALADRDEEVARTGLLLPMEAYRAKASEITQLRVALATATSEVDKDAIRVTLGQATAALERIGASVTAYENLAERVTNTRAEVGAAEQAVEDARSRLAAAAAPESITIAEPTTQSTRTTVVRGAVAALILGLALGLGLVLLIGLLRHPDRTEERHQRRRHEPGRAEPSRSGRAERPDDEKYRTRETALR